MKGILGRFQFGVTSAKVAKICSMIVNTMIGNTFWPKQNSRIFYYTQLPFLPQSRKWKMVPSNSIYLSNTAIFPFHDYRRKGSCLVNHVFPIHSRFASRISCFKNQCVFLFVHLTLDQAFLSFKRFSNLILKQKHFFKKKLQNQFGSWKFTPKKLENGGNKVTSYSWGQLSAPQNHWLHQGLMLWIGWEKNTFDKGG